MLLFLVRAPITPGLAMALGLLTPRLSPAVVAVAGDWPAGAPPHRLALPTPRAHDMHRPDLHCLSSWARTIIVPTPLMQVSFLHRVHTRIDSSIVFCYTEDRERIDEMATLTTVPESGRIAPKRESAVLVKLTAAERAALRAEAARRGYASVSEYVRQATLRAAEAAVRS